MNGLDDRIAALADGAAPAGSSLAVSRSCSGSATQPIRTISPQWRRSSRLSNERAAGQLGVLGLRGGLGTRRRSVSSGPDRPRGRIPAGVHPARRRDRRAHHRLSRTAPRPALAPWDASVSPCSRPRNPPLGPRRAFAIGSAHGEWAEAPAWECCCSLRSHRADGRRSVSGGPAVFTRLHERPVERLRFGPRYTASQAALGRAPHASAREAEPRLRALVRDRGRSLAPYPA